MWILIPSPRLWTLLATASVLDMMQKLGSVEPATTPTAGPLHERVEDNFPFMSNIFVI